MSLKGLTLFLVLSLPGTVSIAQVPDLIIPSELFAEAEVLADSGKYPEAIALLKKIPARDTAYAAAQSRLLYAYIHGDQPDSAIAISEILLSKPSYRRAEYLRLQAIAYSSKTQYDVAISKLQAALREYPADMMLGFALGAVYFDAKQYDKAVGQFLNNLKLHPFQTDSHLNLARISILQGRKVHGMLAMGMYLALQPNDNSQLVLLNQFADNQVSDEGTIAQVGINAAQRLDQIIKAKVIAEDSYETKFPITAPVIQQYELLFDQLGTLPDNSKDAMLNHYLPVYKAIKNAGSSEAFVYHILSSADLDDAKRWRGKNEKALSHFFDVTNSTSVLVREKVALPEFGFPEKTPAWFDDNGRLSALGQITNEKRVGSWVFFDENSEKSAEGKYDNDGKKIGVWKYYHPNGKLKSQEDHTTGETTVYTEAGIKSETFKTKDGEIDGEARLYYPSGQLKQIITFAAGVRQGPVKFYYPDGKAQEMYTYVQGKISGPFESLHPNGKLKMRTTYADNLYNGHYEDFYSNGKPESIGEFVKGYQTGVWKIYHRSGHLAREGSYNGKGSHVGEWHYYDHNGKLVEKRIYDDEGRLHGEGVAYDDGLQHIVAVFKKGQLTKRTYFDRNGKVIASSGNNNGTFLDKGYNILGKLISETNYVNGAAEGPWKYYDVYGNLFREGSSKDNAEQGLFAEYYRHGQKAVEATFEKGELNGKFKRYARHGQVTYLGNYVDGKTEQRWLEYYNDGKLESDIYHIGGNRVGSGYYYAVDGKTWGQLTFEGALIKDAVYFDSRGQRSTSRVEGYNTVYELFFKNKKVKFRRELTSGSNTGRRQINFPDGSPCFEYTMLDDKENGPFLEYDLSGAIESKGNYEDGKREGIWETYHENGKLFSIGKYYQGERDSVWVLYFDNGSIRSKGNWSNGKRIGSFTYYNGEGKPLVEKMFHNDEVIAYRSLAGAAPGEWVDFNGTGTISAKFADGKPAYEEAWARGQQHGPFRTYYASGALYSESMFVNGDNDGDYKYFFANGKLKEKGTYKFGGYQGTMEFYNENGSLWRSTEYLNNFRHGKTILYQNGKKTKELTYWYGLPED